MARVKMTLRALIDHGIRLARDTTGCLSVILLDFPEARRGDQGAPSYEDLKVDLRGRLRAGDRLVPVRSGRMGIVVPGADAGDGRVVAQAVAQANEVVRARGRVGYASFPQDGVGTSELLEAALRRLRRSGIGPGVHAVPLDLTIRPARTSPEFGRPRAPTGMINRPRLVARIKAGEKRRAVFITGGPGFGKSMLLLEYAASTDRSVVWLRLDADDRQALTFIGDLVGACCRQLTDCGHGAEQLLGEQLEAESIARALAQDLATAGPVAIIIDDFQHAEASPEVVRFLDRLLALLPPACHMVIASRPGTLPLMGRLKLSGEAIQIREAELRITLDEARQLAAQVLVSPPERDKVEQVWRYTRGWLIGTRSMLTMDIAAAGPGEDLASYISEEVYNRLSERCQWLLLRLAHLPSFDERIISELFGTGLRGRLRSELENLPFVQATSGPPVQYTFHPIFSDYLKGVSRATLGAHEIERLGHSAGQYFKNNGELQRAIESFIDAPRYEAALESIEVIGADLADAGDRATLEGWLARIPDRAIARHPYVMIIQGLTALRKGRVAEAKRHLRRIGNVLRRRPKGRSLRSRLCVAEGFVARAEHKTNRAWRLAQAGHRYARDPQARIEASVLLALVNQDQGRIDEAIRINQEGLVIADRILSRMKQYFLNNAGTMLMQTGDLPRARSYLERALGEAERSRRLYQQTASMGNLAKVCVLMGDFESGVPRAERALGLARQYEFANCIVQNLNTLAFVRSLQGDARSCLDQYLEALRTAEAVDSPYLTLVCRLKLAGWHLSAGQHENARKILTECAEELVRRPRSVEQVHYLVNLAKLGLVDDDRELAGRSLVQAQRLNEHINSGEHGLRLTIQRHCLDRRTRSVGKGLTLAAVFKQVARTQCYGLLIDELRADPQLLADAFAIETARRVLPALLGNAGPLWLQVRPRLLARLDPEVAEWLGTEPSLASARHDLSFFLLGDERFLVRGRLVNAEHWQRKKVRRLLYLLLLNRNGMSKEKIQAMFWPEAGAANADRNFWNTLYYLRKTLGRDETGPAPIIRRSGRIMLNPSLTVYLDADEFERTVRIAEQLKIRGEAVRAQSAFQKALAMYRGDFLEAHYEECVESKRAYFKELRARARKAIANND